MTGRDLRARATAMAGWLDRRFALHSGGNAVFASATVMAACAFAALLRGQDGNWDLRNYHVYGGWAALHQRLGIDLAPAQMQTYFNPLLDVVHWQLWQMLPAPLAGMLVGALHGLLFPALMAVGWQVLAPGAARARRVPLLALAGLCGAAFLSELGGDMADATTAVFVVAALACVLAGQQAAGRGVRARRWWLCAGALLGLAVAFKLTNALYAVALGLASLAAGGRFVRRVAAAALMALAALAVFAVVAGPWLWAVYRHYGNPLLPQFNQWFGSPWATVAGIADTRFLPRSLTEHLLWPLLFTADPHRISEIVLPQCLWPLLYLAGLGWLVLAALRVQPRTVGTSADGVRTLVVFFVVAYCLWQGVFSIHRYLVVLEAVGPLLLWLAAAMLPWRGASRLAAVAVIACALVGLAGWRDWGHAGWSRQPFAVAAPPMPNPSASMVLLVGGEPQAWRMPFLPADAVYAGIGTNFVPGPAYRARLRHLLDERPVHYAMLPAAVDRRAFRLQGIADQAARLGLSRAPGCRGLRWMIDQGYRAQLQVEGHRCRLLPRADKRLDVAAIDRATVAAADPVLAEYGLEIDAAACRSMPARIGGDPYPYLWCPLVTLAH